LAKGLIIAAPSSGSGKTVVTLGLLRALRDRGVKVASAKIGPDYIDPRFHEAATGATCFNIDGWAMPPAQMRGLIGQLGGDLVVIEGVMGLFDGPEQGRGSTADVSEDLGLPIPHVDASHQAQSVQRCMAATHRQGVSIAGLSSTVSPVTAAGGFHVPCRNCDPRHRKRAAGRNTAIRHLGGAGQRDSALQGFIEAASGSARWTLLPTALARPIAEPAPTTGLPPLGQTIAVASDEAFTFAYPHILASWRRAGAAISTFSPLAGEPPSPGADAIYLPGVSRPACSGLRRA
jgi:cobyrinic acid a,c-diamide synthase